MQQGGEQMSNIPSGTKPSIPERLSSIDISSRERKRLPSVFGSLILAFLVLSIAGTTSAKTVTVENYLKHRNAFRNFHVSWLDGVFNGLKAANAELQGANKTLLFCAPPDFSMTAEQVSVYFDKFIANHKVQVKSSDFIGVLLLDALKETYPCPG
jgi:hypothetical protein